MEMLLDLLIVGVARRGDGRSYIGFAPWGAGGGGFVRLVAPTPSGILHPQQYQLLGGGEPRRWDLVRLAAPWVDSRPMQPENRIVNRTPWELLERPASSRWMRAFEEYPVARGWLLGSRGRAVRESCAGVAASITCVEPGHTRAACVWDARRERYQARLHFLLDGAEYDLALSDLTYAPTVCRMPEGNYALEEIGCRSPHGLRLLISLQEAFHGWCYKTVAGIVPRRTVTLMRDGTSSTIPDADRHAADNVVEHIRSFVVGA